MLNHIKLQYKKPTIKNRGHTQIILNKNPVGYFLPESGLGKDENYRLVMDGLKDDYISLPFKSRREVIEYLNKKFSCSL